MFIFKESYEFELGVDIRVPGKAGVGVQRMICRFVALDQDRLDDLTDVGREDGSVSVNMDVEVLREVLIGWDKVKNEDGEEVPFSPDLRDALLKKPFVRAAMIRAYFEALSGLKRKN